MTNKLINDLTPVGSVTDAMQFETDLGGTTSGKSTALQVSDYIKTKLSTVAATGTYTDLVNKPYTSIAPFSPLSNSALRLWHSFADYQSLTVTSSTILSASLDKSGYHNDAVQTGSVKPTWGQSLFNSTAPGAMFNYSNLVIADHSSIQNIFSSGGYIVMGFMCTGTSTNGMLLGKSTDGAATSGYGLRHYGTTSPKLRFTVGATIAQGNYDISIAYNVPYVLEIFYNTSSPGTAPIIYLNGVKQTVTVVSTTTGTVNTDAGANLIVGNSVDLGAGTNFIGQISQLLMYRGTLSASFLARLRSYVGALSTVPSVPVYIQAGQSNSVGNALLNTTTYLSGAYLSNNQRPLIYDGVQFVPLTPGNNNRGQDASMFGPEISFGIFQSSIMGQSAYIIKYAKGATSLAVDWSPTGPGAQWTLLNSTVASAMAVIGSQGKIPVVEAFLWTQGETDGQNSTHATAYQTNLTNFVAAVLSTTLVNFTLSPTYTFIISGLPNQSVATIPYVAQITTAQINVGAVAGNAYINTKDLSLNGDQVHIDAAGQIELGKRFSQTVPSSAAQMYSNYINNPWPSDLVITRSISTTDVMLRENYGRLITPSLASETVTKPLIWLRTQDQVNYAAGPICGITLENTATDTKYGSLNFATGSGTTHTTTYSLAVDPSRNNSENFGLLHRGNLVFEVKSDDTEFRFWQPLVMQAWNGVSFKATNLANSSTAQFFSIGAGDVLQFGATTTWTGGFALYPGSGAHFKVLNSGTVLANGATDNGSDKLIVNGTAKATAFNTNSSTSSTLKTTVSTTTYGTGAPISLWAPASGKTVSIQFYDTVQDAYISLIDGSRLALGMTTEAMAITSASNLIIGKITDDGVNKLQVAGGASFGAASSSSATAVVEISSTTKGFLPPKMTTTQKNAITTPAEGLMVYDVTLHKLCVYTGSAWETITSV